MEGATTPRRGRPPGTTHREVERIALGLFATHGYEETTMDEIAAAAGMHGRTLFRYFPSKPEIVWSDFNRVLGRMRDELAKGDPDEPMMDVLTQAAIRSNHYPPDQLPELRIRMTLITTVPSLQAHSMLRYAAWRTVVAEFAAQRLGAQPDDLAPQALGFMAFGASMAAFTQWVQHPSQDLEHHLATAYRLLPQGLPHA